MKNTKLLMLVAATALLGGCMATVTPTGDVYTEALLPVDTTVIVERAPLVAYGPRPHFRSAPPPRPRGHLRPGAHFVSARGPHHRSHARYGAPGQHRSPGQHRAPGVRGPKTRHITPSFRGGPPNTGRSNMRGTPKGTNLVPGGKTAPTGPKGLIK